MHQLKLVTSSDPAAISKREMIKVEGGGSVSAAARRGIALQKEGLPPAEAARQIGLSRRVFSNVRDMLLLSDRSDLSEKDATLVAEALAEVETTLNITRPWQRVRPLADRVWGNKGARFSDGDKRREARFVQAISFVATTCESAAEIDIPHVSEEQLEEAIGSLSLAIAAITRLRRRIIRETEQ
jgi:hypothetical protein